MFNFSLFSFLIVLVFLIFATYYDIKKRIVPNYLVFSLFIIGILSQAIKSIVLSNFSIFTNTLLSILLTAIICYVLWELGVFAGGDLKLFVAISAINPFNINLIGQSLGYTIVSDPIFPITLLIASIISIAPVLLIISIYKIIFQKDYYLMLDILKSKKTMVAVLNSIIILFFITSFTNIFSLSAPYLIILLISIALIFIFNKVQAYNIKSFYLSLIVLYLFLFIFAISTDNLKIFSLSSLLDIIIVILVIFFFMTFYKVVKQKVLSTTKNINDLKEGDLLVYNYYKKNNKVIVKKLTFIQTIKQMLNGTYNKYLIIDSKKAKGLDSSNISFLKDSYKNNLVQQTFKVKQTVPFIPAVLLAYILLNIFGDIIWIII